MTRPGPPKPDGGLWDPTAGGAAATSSTAKSIWDLGDLDPNVEITVDYGNPYSRIPKQLPGEDRDAAYRPPTPGKPETLLKEPIRLFTTDKKAYLAFQHQLFQGGWYGDKSPNSVLWGADPLGTQSAWSKVLLATQQAQAAGQAITPLDLLAQSAKDRADNLPGAEKHPSIIQLDDPRLIAGTAQKAAQAVLGHNLDDAEIKAFVSHFQAEQSAYSKSRQAASEADTAGTGGSFTLTEPDLGAAADQSVQEEHGTEIAGNSMADYVGVLERMLSGG